METLNRSAPKRFPLVGLKKPHRGADAVLQFGIIII